jgi:putative transcriptional regulator
MDPKSKLKNKLKVYRAIEDISQNDLAQSLSVSRQTINSIENNVYVPSVLLAMKIAMYFKASVEDIFYINKEDA